MGGRWLLLAVALAAPAAAAAQSSGVADACANPQVPQASREFCGTVAQAVESLQPQIGIAVTGGNVTPGSASAGGMHLGFLPGVSVTGKVNFALARFPNVVKQGAGSGTTEEKSLPAPAIAGTAALGVFPGLSVAPTIGGIGQVSLLGAVSWLPIKASQLGGFQENTATTSYGVGARVGLLKESFTMPGISVSLMYHKLGRVGYGTVCPSPQRLAGSTQSTYTIESGVCTASGDPGQIAFDLSDVSARAQISKHFLVFGLAAGIGHDRWSSAIDYGFRSACPVAGAQACYVRVSDAELESSRWSAFGNLSIGALLGSLVFEGGWLQGSEPITSFRSAINEFDPKKGTLFGSAGLRISF